MRGRGLGTRLGELSLSRPYALRVCKSCPECGVTCPEYCLSLLLCFLCPPATALFLLVWRLASRCSCVSSDLLRQSCSLRTCRLVCRCSRATLAFRRLHCSLACLSLAFRSASTTTHSTVHDHAWHGAVAWARATYQYHVTGTDTVGRS